MQKKLLQIKIKTQTQFFRYQNPDLNILNHIFNLFVKNKISKKIPTENHIEFSFKNVYKIVNKDNIKIFKL